MKNRKWIALALAAAMVGSLTACGGGAGATETTAAAAADHCSSGSRYHSSGCSSTGRRRNRSGILVHVGVHRAPGPGNQGSS